MLWTLPARRRRRNTRGRQDLAPRTSQTTSRRSCRAWRPHAPARAGGECRPAAPISGMHTHHGPRALERLRPAMRPGLGWPALYRLAVATCCDQCLSDEKARIAAVDELLAHALAELL